MLRERFCLHIVNTLSKEDIFLIDIELFSVAVFCFALIYRGTRGIDDS